MWINDYLRNPAPFGWLSETEKSMLSELDSMTKNDTVKQNKLYRAVSADVLLWNLNEDTWDELLDAVYGWKKTTRVKNIFDKNIWKEIVEKAFLSTTTDKNIADDWWSFTDWIHEVTVEFEVPEGVKGKDLSAYDIEDDPQKEVLLARGTKYEITDILPNEWEWGLLIKAKIKK